MTMVAGIESRWRVLGRVRLGKRGARNAPQRLTSFRLTSHNRTLIEEAALLYGGVVAPWEEQWEVITDTDALDIMVPPSPAAFEQSWQMWSADGLQRSCNGLFQEDNVPCACPDDTDERRHLAKDGKACWPTTRLSFLLPDLTGLGVWLMSTRGYNAAAELMGISVVLKRAREAGVMFRGTLRMEQRSTKQPGQPRHDFVVPTLDVPVKLGLMLESMGMVDQLPPPGALSAPAPSLANTYRQDMASEKQPAAQESAAPADDDDDEVNGAAAVQGTQLARLTARLRALRASDGAIVTLLSEHYKVGALTDLTVDDADDFLAMLRDKDSDAVKMLAAST